MLIEASGSRCSNVMVGAVNDVEVPKIFRSITFSRGAC
jgi:hypothetical protein